MNWLELTIECAAEESERLEAILQEMGAAAVTLADAADQPLFEPAPGTTPLWNRMLVIGLFTAERDEVALRRELAAALAPQPLPPLRLQPLEDRDWERSWMDGFEPLRFGERLWIVPSWFEPPEPHAVNILLDPGLAFGTGTHATTRLCLEWLDAHPPVDQPVIDYGCGSGILAVAAARLGAAHVCGVDNDPQALTATMDNAAANAVAGCIEAHLPEPGCPGGARLLLANILAGPLIELAPKFASLVESGGALVLSGILAEQAEQVAEAYRADFVMDPPAELDGWVRLSGSRR